MSTSGAASGPPVPAGMTGELLPAVHRVASLAKRWLLGTHQGSVAEAHMPAHLDEFVFRFNRRRSAAAGVLVLGDVGLARAGNGVFGLSSGRLGGSARM